MNYNMEKPFTTMYSGMEIGASDISRQIDAHHQFTSKKLDLMAVEIGKEINKLGGNRRPRKVQTDNVLSFTQSGTCYLQTWYDDGTVKSEPFFDNICSVLTICRITFDESVSNKELFMICFEAAQMYVVGEYKKLSANYLMDCFIEYGIRFNPRIKRSVCKNTLYDTFLPLIKQCMNVTKFKSVTGWQKNHYLTKNDIDKRVCIMYKELPIMHKSMDLDEVLDKSILEKYIKCINAFKNEDLRFAFVVSPIIGILSTLYSREDVNANIYFNLVTDNKVSVKVICSYLQLFNREKKTPLSLLDSSNSAKRILAEANDELVIINAKREAAQSRYQQNKVIELEKYLIDVLSGDLAFNNTNMRVPHISIVALSNDIIFDDRVINVLLDSDDYNNISDSTYMDMDVMMSAYFQSFMNYVEDQMTYIISIIREVASQCGVNKRLLLLSIYKMIEGFWKHYDKDINTEIDISCESAVQKLLESKDIEDLTCIFVEGVRSNIGKYQICEKRELSQDMIPSNVIIYDDNYVWIHNLILEDILSNLHMKQHKSILLCQLKKEKHLITSREGMKKRVVINDIAYELYQIERSLFDKPGYRNLWED